MFAGVKIRPFSVKILLCAAIFSPVSAAAQQSPQVQKTLTLGNDEMRAGHLDEAAAAFAKVVKLDPTFAQAYFNLALARIQQGRTEESVTLLEKSIKLKPTLRGAHLFLGMAQCRMGIYDSAESALKTELKVDPANSDAWMWLGIAQTAQGNPLAAAASLDKAAALKPNDVDILYHQGQAHMLVSKRSYEHLFDVDPKSWRVHQILAQSYTDADRLDEAIHECEQALQSNPGEPGLHEQLADIYWKQNQLEKAEAEFQSELHRTPHSASVRYKLAVVSLERSKPEMAVDLLRDVLRRAPKSLEAHYQLGRGLAQTNAVDEAIDNFSYVVSANGPSNTEILRQSYYQLSQLYRRARKAHESEEALQAFLKLKQEADATQEQKSQDRLAHSMGGLA